uniref:hypothetical protein n=1 Tax=Fuscoporia viticola TaxID=139386 RepID=UPI0023AB19E2|nr:hypothetical protein P1Q19_mgp29 [Fuscoporia viticola]WCF76830.1 hypothetical protein [Fuscoporia viticola]
MKKTRWFFSLSFNVSVRLIFILFIVLLFKFNIINSETIDRLNILTVLGVSDIVMKRLVIFSLVISFICILRYICIIYVIYLHSKNKISTSILMPSFFSNWIKYYEETGKSENAGFMINFYYKHMYVYIFIFLWNLFMLYVL